MKIEKCLIIEKIELTSMSNAPYCLFLHDPQDYQLKSELTIGKKELIDANITPTGRIIGKKLLISLKSAKRSQKGGNSNTLLIEGLQKVSSTNWIYGTIPPIKQKKEQCIAHIETPVMRGLLTMLPCPLYDLKLLLTENEYKKFSLLPKDTVFKIEYHLSAISPLIG